MSSEIILPREALPLLLRELARLNPTIESLKILGRFRMPVSDVAVTIFAELEASAGTIENGAAERTSMFFDMAVQFPVLWKGLGTGIAYVWRETKPW